MLKVNNSLCLGCASCAQSCPEGAITLIWGKAEIDTRKCNSCYQCVDVCPHGAIAEIAVILPAELRVTVLSLGRQADDIIQRIDSLLSKTDVRVPLDSSRI